MKAIVSVLRISTVTASEAVAAICCASYVIFDSRKPADDRVVERRGQPQQVIGTPRSARRRRRASRSTRGRTRSRTSRCRAARTRRRSGTAASRAASASTCADVVDHRPHELQHHHVGRRDEQHAEDGEREHARDTGACNGTAGDRGSRGGRGRTAQGGRRRRLYRSRSAIIVARPDRAPATPR